MVAARLDMSDGVHGADAGAEAFASETAEALRELAEDAEPSDEESEEARESGGGDEGECGRLLSSEPRPDSEPPMAASFFAK
jgi:hypothetical protein